MQLSLSNINQAILARVLKSAVVVEAYEVRQNDNRTTYYNAIFLARNKDNIFIKEQLINIGSNDLKEWLSNSIPKEIAILLIINSDNILNRITEYPADINNSIQAAVPGTGTEEFTGNIFEIGNTKGLLSIARRTYITQILKQVSDDVSSRIIRVCIGPGPILFAYGNTHNHSGDFQINIRNYSFSFEDDILTSIRTSSHQIAELENTAVINTGTDNILASLYLCFSYGVYYMIHPISCPGISIPEINTNHDAFNFARTGKAIIYTAAAILLTLLLSSSTLFTSYSHKHELLSSEYFSAKKQWESIKAQKEKELKQQSVFENAGIGIESNITFISDQITCSLPEDIYLRKMSIHPVNLKSIDDNTAFYYDKIFIEGNCYTSNELNDWIDILKKHTWVAQVKINEYKQPNENEIGAFIIEIQESGL